MLVKKTIFYGRITIFVSSIVTIAKQSQVRRTIQTIVDETGLDEDGRDLIMYAQCCAYIEDFKFKFKGDEPDRFTNLEKWWKGRQEGVEISESYVFFRENVDVLQLLPELYEAIQLTQEIWKPEEEKETKSEDQETTDPN